METSLKPGFAQIFSCCPKNLSCPKFGGAAAPLAPRPARLCVWGERRKKENLLTPWVLKTMNDIRSSLKDGEGVLSDTTQWTQRILSYLSLRQAYLYPYPPSERQWKWRAPFSLWEWRRGTATRRLYTFFSFVYRSVKVFFFNLDWALAELMSWTRWIGLRLAFILQMKKYLLSYHNLFLFSLELVWKNSLWETERGVRRGLDGMGWADHWDESSVKRGCMKEEWKSGAIYMLIYGHWWPSNRLKSNKLLILWNQIYVQFE